MKTVKIKAKNKLTSGTTSLSTTSKKETSGWTFLSSHGHVLVCVAKDPNIRLRDVAAAVGITERSVQKIVNELETCGILTRQRTGRRNSYRLHPDCPLRHPLESHRDVAALLRMVLIQSELKNHGL